MDGQKAQFKMFALVRDAEGRPKFDDIFNIPVEIWDMLTDPERRAIETEILKRKQRGVTNGSYPSHRYPKRDS